MTPRSRLAIGLGLALLAARTAFAQTPPPALLFYAAFDGASKPDFAAGGDEVLLAGRVAFHPGHKGQAVKPLPETAGYRKLIGGGLEYSGPGNLDFDRGSVAFWWHTDFESADRTKPARLPGRMPVQAPVTNHGPFYVFEYFNELRFHLGDQSCQGTIPGWHKGEWHFLAATWDRAAGLELYADGRLVAAAPATWGRYPAPEWFRLGLQKQDYDIEGLLDEFMIFDGPLTAAEVADLMAGKLPLRHATKRPPAGSAAATEPAGPAPAPARAVRQFRFAEGEQLPVVVSNNVSFVAGLTGRGLRTQANSQFALAVPKLLDPQQGALSFWFRPDWQFALGEKTTFLASTGGPSAPLALWQQIYRYGVIYQYRAGTEGVLNGSVTQAGEWYFVTLSWRDGQLAGFSLDGRCESSPPRAEGASLTNAPARDTLWLGSAAGENGAAATFAALTIWDAPLTRPQIVAEVEHHKPLQMFITQKAQAAGAPLRPVPLFYNRLAHPLRLAGQWDLIAPAGQVAATGRLARRQLAPQTWTRIAIDTKLTATPGTWIVRYHPGPGLADLSDYCYVPEHNVVRGSPDPAHLPTEGLPPGRGDLRSAAVRGRETGAQHEETGAQHEETGAQHEDLGRPGPALTTGAATPETARSFASLRMTNTPGTLVDEIDCGTERSAQRIVTDKFCRVVASPLGRYLEAGAPRLSRFALKLNVKHPETRHYLVLEVPDDKERDCLINNVRWRDNLSTGYLTGGEYRQTGTLQEFVIPVYPHESELMFTLMNQQADKPSAVKGVRLYEAAQPPAAAQAVLPARLPRRVIGEHYEQTEIETWFADTPNCGIYALPPDRTYRAWDRYTAFLANTGQNLVDLPFGWYDGLSFPSATEEFVNPCGHAGVWYLLELAGQRGLKVIPQLTFRTAYPLAVAVREFRGPPEDDPLLQVAWDGTALTTPTWGVPMFNPLHPTVQRVFRQQVEDLMIHYGNEPALGGVALVGSGWASTWFVDLARDYSDYTVGLFEKETGLKVPTAPGKQRFAARCQFLADDARRETWVAWRCRKIKEFDDALGAVIQKHRPDLKLYASVYPITDADAEDVILHGASLKEKYREAGIDPDLFAHDRRAVVRFEYNIDVAPSLRAATDFSPAPFLPMRDLEYLPEGFASLAAGKERAFTLHRLYFENCADWGMAKEAPDLPGLWIADRLHLPSWQSFLCNTPAALGRNFLKQLALDVANNDPLLIEHGGIWPIVGHERELREFALAFRALPAVRFADHPGLEDPVRLRTLSARGRYFFYLVNREPYALEVELNLAGTSGAVLNLGTGERLRPAAGGPLRLRLAAYQLGAFAAPGGARIAGARVVVPAAEIAALQQRIAKLRQLLARDKETGPGHAQAAATVDRLGRALAQGHYSLARLLSEGTIIRQLTDRTPS